MYTEGREGCVHAHMNEGAQGPEEGIRFPGAGLTSGCKLPHMSARN